MASITVNTNGQTLTVNADISHWTSAALAVVASGDDDVPSTTTTTITDDYTMHFANTATTATITVKQLDGTTLLAQAFPVTPGHGPRTLNPLPTVAQLAGDVQHSEVLSTTALDVFPRREADSTSSLTSQVVYLQFFDAPASVEVDRISYATGSTAAATVTTIKYGLYLLDDATGDVSLVARTANDATAHGSTNTVNTEVFATAGGYPATYTLTAGLRYATAVLVDASTAGNLRATVPASKIAVLTPKLCASQAAQTDLPTDITAANLAETGIYPWARLTRV